MSGILALVNHQDSLNTHDMLQQMQEAVLHRGKDGHGIWIDGIVGIGHQRFATTPESKYEQSPTLDGQGYAISADVRLDNRAELISQLQLDGTDLDQLTDPSLILHAYQAWGTNCPSKLLGAFAFILWDPVNQKLFGARDHLGVKPFYYYQHLHGFAVASEIKALLQYSMTHQQSLPQLSHTIDPIRIADLLCSQLKDQARTTFQGILRLPAAHHLEYSLNGTVEIQRYWQLDPNHTIEYRNDEEYCQEFLTLFKAAVQCRLRHQVPIGSQLSGGMDSSSITAMAEKLLSGSETKLKTFSATFSQVPECDETHFIQEVLDAGQFEPYFIAADQSGPLTHWQELFQSLDEPAMGNGYLSWLMNIEAKKQGVHIVLNGYDGDTVVGHGTLYPYELAREGKWSQALEEAKIFIQRFAVEGVTPLTWMRTMAFEILMELKQEQQWGLILRSIPQISKPLQLKPFRLFLKFVLRPYCRKLLRRSATLTPPVEPSLKTKQIEKLARLNPEFLRKFKAKIQAHQAQFTRIQPKPLTVRQDQWQTLSSGIIVFPMELLDQVSATFQIEPRYPFMDKRLVEFCLALPPNQKLRHGWSRYILHRSMEGILPPKVQWRATKTNLSNAFEFGLNQYDQDILHEVLFENAERLAAFIDLSGLSEICENSRNQATLIEELWPTITLSLWLKSRTGLGINIPNP